MRRFAESHPNLVTWLVLAVGMLAVLGWSARDVGLTATQGLWLAVATALLAGLCAWIISWEADDDLAEEGFEEPGTAGDEPAAPDQAAAAAPGGEGGAEDSSGR